ncbi:Prp19 complex subunit, ubiquitin-protein ligase E4 Prp19 [Schizosaccharomyces osmophilus]|uniref:Pre-mRNA-processing factor 19 n=1 Tax=Schizosaccharomyces osmophilus TaxID=2545709 RepID=A0AAE9WCS3_9SCHI|nr:Prp19 complex subunit, ubiquitin-protein ligase E4 Prp19 [Schizosaccharomyces osmophilus]WBW73874.1 Prp19 complex subunit, ubiquitin-protein ligase E4 Prp19 [Schizosaccharomyces osmophilus]
MFCSISGETPKEPVVSRVSGSIYERRLIEQAINETSKDPVTQQECSLDDLVPVKVPDFIKPRPPSATSLPALLSLFQEEWDALALEQFDLRKKLSETKQELSTSLYSLDAAFRVISRLTKERDEAREALAKFSDNVSSMSQPENLDVEMKDGSQDTKASLKSTVDETLKQLSTKRKQTKLQPTWATPEVLEKLAHSSPLPVLPSAEKDVKTLLIPRPGGTGVSLCLVDSRVSLVDCSSSKPLKSFDSSITACCWLDISKIALMNSDTKMIEVYDVPSEVESVSEPSFSIPVENENVMFLSAHSSGEYIVAATDATCTLYSMKESVYSLNISAKITALSFHPDGHIFAVGLENGEIQFFETASGVVAAKFGPQDGSIESLQFGENGYWLAAVASNEKGTSIWHLGKSKLAHMVPTDASTTAAALDITCQLLASSDDKYLYIHSFVKASKSWNLVGKVEASLVSNLAWIEDPHKLVYSTNQGSVCLLESIN